MKDQWISVKQDLPKDDEQRVLFIQWHDEWKTSITDYYGKWRDIKIFRKFDLENNYTHWQPIEPPKTTTP